MSTKLYILDARGEMPILCPNADTWGRWFNEASPLRIVAKTTVGDAEVSTVFLGIDHDFSGAGPPILWETMIFGGTYDSSEWRYTSAADAREGHEKAVAFLKAEPSD